MTEQNIAGKTVTIYVKFSESLGSPRFTAFARKEDAITSVYTKEARVFALTLTVPENWKIETDADVDEIVGEFRDLLREGMVQA